MLITSLSKRAFQACMAGAAAVALVAADEPTKSPAEAGCQRPAVKRRKSRRRSTSRGPTIPNGSTCSRRSCRTSRWARSYGWFRTAVAQTRFDWDSTRKRYDRDGDGRIARAEFPGGDADFARLDRDHDKSLTAADFDFSASAWLPRPARWCFRGSIETAAARSPATSSTLSSRTPTAAARASCRSPTFRRRLHLRRRSATTVARCGPTVQGHARSRPVPPGDRFAPARSQARRVCA